MPILVMGVRSRILPYAGFAGRRFRVGSAAD
jgi:hypothetical protein